MSQEGYTPALDLELLVAHATKFSFVAGGRKAETLDDSVNEITVEWRSSGQWAVVRRSFVYTRDESWEWEPLPSTRDAAFFARARYSFAEAIELAMRLVDG